MIKNEETARKSSESNINDFEKLKLKRIHSKLFRDKISGIGKKFVIKDNKDNNRSLNFSIEKDSTTMSESSTGKRRDLQSSLGRSKEKKKGIFDLKYNTNNITFNNIVIKDNFGDDYATYSGEKTDENKEGDDVKRSKHPLSLHNVILNKRNFNFGYLNRNRFNGSSNTNSNLSSNSEIIQLKQRIAELMQENSKLQNDKEELVNENKLTIDQNGKLRNMLKLEKLENSKQNHIMTKSNKELKERIEHTENENKNLKSRLEKAEKKETENEKTISKLTYRLELMEDLLRNKDKELAKFKKLTENKKQFLKKQPTFGLGHNTDNQYLLSEK